MLAQHRDCSPARNKFVLTLFNDKFKLLFLDFFSLLC